MGGNSKPSPAIGGTGNGSGVSVGGRGSLQEAPGTYKKHIVWPRTPGLEGEGTKTEGTLKLLFPEGKKGTQNTKHRPFSNRVTMGQNLPFPKKDSKQRGSFKKKCNSFPIGFGEAPLQKCPPPLKEHVLLNSHGLERKESPPFQAWARIAP